MRWALHYERLQKLNNESNLGVSRCLNGILQFVEMYWPFPLSVPIADKLTPWRRTHADTVTKQKKNAGRFWNIYRKLNLVDVGTHIGNEWALQYERLQKLNNESNLGVSRCLNGIFQFVEMLLAVSIVCPNCRQINPLKANSCRHRNKDQHNFVLLVCVLIYIFCSLGFFFN